MAARIRVAVAIVLLVFLGAAALLSLNNGYQAGLEQASADEAKPVELRIAVANEDRGVLYGGERISLGSSYVQQLQQDGSADWYVVPRSVAEAGIQDGTYDLMLVLPVDLSETVLSLDAEDPTDANITYQVGSGLAPRAEAIADAKGRDVVSGLGKQLTQLFASAILANLVQAQGNVQAVLSVESKNSATFSKKLAPQTKEFGKSLTTVTDASGRSFKANDGTIKSMDSLTEMAQGTTKSFDAHATSLQELVAARAAGAITFQQFTSQIMAMNSTQLSKEIKEQYEQLQALGDSLASQFKVESETDNLTTRVASLNTLLAELSTVIEEKIATVDDMDDATLLATYRPAAIAAMDTDESGTVDLREFLTFVQNGADDGPLTDLAARLAAYQQMYESLTAQTQAAIAALPYRSQEDLDLAVSDGVFAQIGGEFATTPDAISEQLAQIAAMPGYEDIAADPSSMAGKDLKTLANKLAGLETTGPCAVGATTAGCDWTKQVGPTAAQYGRQVGNVEDAYAHAAALVAELAKYPAPTEAIWEWDVTSGLDAVIVAAVRQSATDVKGFLAELQLRTGKLGSLGSELDTSVTELSKTTKSLTENISGQLAVWQTTKEQLGRILALQDAVSQSLTTSDQMTTSTLAEAKALAASSAALVTSSQASKSQAEGTKDLLAAFDKDAVDITKAAGLLNKQSDDLKTAILKQVEATKGFSSSFEQVLANSHDSDVLNQSLITFISDPVSASPRAVVASSDVTKPFPWVTISFTIALIAAYLLSRLLTVTRRRSAYSRRRQDWFGPNVRWLAITAGVAAAAGVVVAILSARDMGIGREQALGWGLLVVMIMLQFTLLCFWLIRQFRTMGVAITVLLLVGFVFVSNAVGALTPTTGLSGMVVRFSPLCQAESSMMSILAGGSPGIAVYGTLGAWILVLVGLCLVIQKDLLRLIPRRLRGAKAATA